LPIAALEPHGAGKDRRKTPGVLFLPFQAGKGWKGARTCWANAINSFLSNTAPISVSAEITLCADLPFANSRREHEAVSGAMIHTGHPFSESSANAATNKTRGRLMQSTILQNHASETWHTHCQLRWRRLADGIEFSGLADGY
jgi:hypothetical protein